MGAPSTAQPAGAPGKTVYITNLNDRVKLPELIEGLRILFSEYGSIVDINVKSNFKAKGQAFVVFDNNESAAKAIEDINGFEIFRKPMVCAHARMKSDATVRREGSDADLEAHKRHRLAEKERKKAQEEHENRKRPPPTDTPTGAQAPAKKGLKSTGSSKAGIIPDEYLPPNKILFLQNIPDDYDEDSLSVIFGRFEGFKEVRIPPGGRGIGFVEYEAEAGAISAKEHTAGMTLSGNQKVKVTYQRK